jgi:hypothetical protein
MKRNSDGYQMNICCCFFTGDPSDSLNFVKRIARDFSSEKRQEMKNMKQRLPG